MGKENTEKMGAEKRKKGEVKECREIEAKNRNEVGAEKDKKSEREAKEEDIVELIPASPETAKMKAGLEEKMLRSAISLHPRHSGQRP